MSFTTPRRCRISFVARAGADWSNRMDRRICRSGKEVWQYGSGASSLTDMNAHKHAHDHGNHGTHQPDWDAFAPFLVQEAETHAPIYEQAAAWLRERFAAADSPVRRVLDVGSGPGVVTCLLAQAFPDAEVVATDG